jgi:hypothetical protein
MNERRIASLLSTCILILSLAGGALGQAVPGASIGFDPSMLPQMIAQSQKRSLDHIKTLIGSSDDEFAALSPFVEKILEMKIAEQINDARGMMAHGGSAIVALAAPGGNAAQSPQVQQAAQMMQQLVTGLSTYNFGRPPSELQVATNELSAAIEDRNSTPDFLANKLAAFRAARNKAADDLKQTQDALKQLLTQKQEGLLVMEGLLP